MRMRYGFCRTSVCRTCAFLMRVSSQHAGRTGQRDETAIALASDHGKMLGDRGMWFKTHFDDPTLKMPRIRRRLVSERDTL